MTFRLFGKNISSKKSAISYTEEREFEREVERVEKLEEKSKTIYRKVRNCLEAHSGIAKVELKLADDLDRGFVCRDDESLRKYIECWLDSSRRMDLTVNEFTSTSQKTMVDPMKKFSTIFPSVQTAVRKRESSLQEYSKCLTRYEKSLEKGRTGNNIVLHMKNKKSLEAAKEIFEPQNQGLLRDLAALYQGRIDYFEPSLLAFKKSQIKYYTENHKLYDDLCKKLNIDEIENSKEVHEIKIKQKLGEIRALSITVDD